MTIWLLIMFAVEGGQISGAALVAPFATEEACIVSRQYLGTTGQNIRHTRCVEVSLGEGA